MGRETARIRYLSVRRSKVTVVAPNENLSRLAEMQTQRKTLTRRGNCCRCRQGAAISVDYFGSSNFGNGLGADEADRTDLGFKPDRVARRHAPFDGGAEGILMVRVREPF